MLKQKGFQGEKLEAAYLLLAEDSTTLEKTEKVRVLLKGIDPSLDRVLEKFSKVFLGLGKLEKGEALSLSAEALPEKTAKEKKRKKALLLFFTHWRSLKSEVARVQKVYLEESNNPKGNTNVKSFSTFGKVMGLAKGPLGLVTFAAVAIVGLLSYLKVSSVSVNIKNDGCASLDPYVRMPFSIPGLVLPTKPIANGETANATLPPLKFNVDGTNSKSVNLSVLRYTLSFDTGNLTSIVLDGKNLLGASGKVDLGSSKNHSLVIRCGN